MTDPNKQALITATCEVLTEWCSERDFTISPSGMVELVLSLYHGQGATILLGGAYALRVNECPTRSKEKILFLFTVMSCGSVYEIGMARALNEIIDERTEGRWAA